MPRSPGPLPSWPDTDSAAQGIAPHLHTYDIPPRPPCPSCSLTKHI